MVEDKYIAEIGSSGESIKIKEFHKMVQSPH